MMSEIASSSGAPPRAVDVSSELQNMSQDIISINFLHQPRLIRKALAPVWE